MSVVFVSYAHVDEDRVRDGLPRDRIEIWLPPMGVVSVNADNATGQNRRAHAACRAQ